MDAQGLLHALIAHYADRTYGRRGACTSGDLLTHAAMIVWGLDEEGAVERVGEEITEHRIAGA